MSPVKQRRGRYLKQQLVDAIREVNEGKMTSLEAAKRYNVPSSTIRCHVNEYSSRIGGGPSFYLNDKQEKYLVEAIQSLESIGVRLTKPVLEKVCAEYVQLVSTNPRYSNEKLSHHWLKDFLNRNKKQIKMVKEKKLERSRRDGFSEDVRSGWFKNLNEVLTKNDLLYKPLQIWNVDESGFNDETQTEWICVSADKQFVYEADGGSGKSFTTVVVCGNAAGICLPPYTIYAAKNVNGMWCQRGPDRAQYNCSNSGWIHEKLFIDWFENLFLVETSNVPRPLLLLMDNLSAHISIKIIELALKNQVILMCLPPNTTHCLQPLDLSTFGVMKTKWKQIVTAYFRKTKRKSIRKIDFPVLLNSLYESAVSVGSVSGGFRRGGISPFDENAMKDKVVPRRTTHAQADTQATITSSTAIDVLNSLLDDIGVPPTDVHDVSASVSNASVADVSSTNAYNVTAHSGAVTSTPSQMIDDLASFSSRRRPQTFDDEDDVDDDNDESNSSSSMNGRALKRQKLANDDTSRAEYNSTSNNKFSSSTGTSTSKPTLLSPQLAVQSIISIYSKNNSTSTMSSTTTNSSNSRIRAERKYGENITSGNLLEQLKKKQENKSNTSTAKKPEQYTRKKKN